MHFACHYQPPAVSGPACTAFARNLWRGSSGLAFDDAGDLAIGVIGLRGARAARRAGP